MTIFDTDIMIDYLNGKERAAGIIAEHGGDGVAITAVTGYELVKGYKDRQEEAALGELFERVTIYPLDRASMKIAGEMYRRLRREGKLKKEADVLIAGIAAANSKLLVTDDKDFYALEEDMEGRLLVLKKSG
jgi:hypothetical protein